MPKHEEAYCIEDARDAGVVGLSNRNYKFDYVAWVRGYPKGNDVAFMYRRYGDEHEGWWVKVFDPYVDGGMAYPCHTNDFKRAKLEAIEIVSVHRSNAVKPTSSKSRSSRPSSSPLSQIMMHEA